MLKCWTSQLPSALYQVDINQYKNESNRFGKRSMWLCQSETSHAQRLVEIQYKWCHFPNRANTTERLLRKIKEIQVALGNHSFYVTILLCSVSIHPNPTHSLSFTYGNSYIGKIQDRRQDVGTERWSNNKKTLCSLEK